MESRQNAEAKERPSNPRRLRRITKTWEIGKKSTAQHDAWIDNEITAAYRVYRGNVFYLSFQIFEIFQNFTHFFKR